MPADKVPFDENVKIPAAVKAAAANADKVFQTAYAAPAFETPPATGADAVPPPEAPLTTTPETTPPKSDVTPAGNEPKPDDWENRYKAMKGRFDRSEQSNRTLSQQLESLQNVVSTMQTPAAQNTPASAEPMISPEERETWGGEFLDVVGKRAKEQLSPELAKVSSELENLKKRLDGVSTVTAQTARNKMFTDLDTAVANWRDINRNQNFIEWLELPETYSGVKRMELLQAAFEQNNAPRVVAFFQGFLSEEAALAPQPNAEQHPSGGAPVDTKVPLETFAAPSRAKTAAGNPPAEKPTFTRVQIAKFYADVAAGKFRGKDAEKDRFEAQIFDAERNGRIR